jgi:hypothetical protein
LCEYLQLDDLNTYSTLVVALATAILAVLTGYYAKQTRDLTRNQFRPYCFSSIVFATHDSKTYNASLQIENIGVGVAEDVKIEYFIYRNKKKSEKILLHIPLLKRDDQRYQYTLYQNRQESEQLLYNPESEDVVDVKLKYRGIFGGKYNYKQRLRLRTYFDSQYDIGN